MTATALLDPDRVNPREHVAGIRQLAAWGLHDGIIGALLNLTPRQVEKVRDDHAIPSGRGVGRPADDEVALAAALALAADDRERELARDVIDLLSVIRTARGKRGIPHTPTERAA